MQTQSESHTPTARTGSWPLIITTSIPPTPKTLNRVLILLRDYEYTITNGKSIDVATILTSRTLPTSPPPATVVPVSNLPSPNEFELATLADLYTFTTENKQQLKDIGFKPTLYLILDDTGLTNSTCIVVEHNYFFKFNDPNSDEYLDDPSVDTERNRQAFRAARVPYSQVWIMMANLRISNMDFDDYISGAVQNDGTYNWRPLGGSDRPDLEGKRREVERKREKTLDEAKRQGWID